MKDVIVAAVLLLASQIALAVPPIEGKPRIVAPTTLLDWPADFPAVKPNLTEPTSNRLDDFHGVIRACDAVLSTAGNYHMALREMWHDVFLAQNEEKLKIKTWFYTTSPPVVLDHVKNQVVQFGNLEARCMPQVAVAPAATIDKLVATGATVGDPLPIIKNFGNVIFVKKGNPKNIHSVWDLGRPDVVLVTANPEMESGSFGNFSGSIYEIAANDPNPPKGMTAEKLFKSIFDNDPAKCGSAENRCKWVTGKRIMHREQPWAVDSGEADAGIIFYHLALYFTRSFPEKFEIIALGGTAEKPEPVKGNKVGAMSAVRVKADWTDQQKQIQDKMMEALSSDAFTAILQKHGLRRP